MTTSSRAVKLKPGTLSVNAVCVWEYSACSLWAKLTAAVSSLNKARYAGLMPLRQTENIFRECD